MTSSSETSLQAEKQMLVQQVHQFKKHTDELETQLARVTRSQSMKERAAQEAEEKTIRVEIELALRNEELEGMRESINVLESRSAASEKHRGEADSEIISLLQRAQEAESWQMTIREGVSKVMELLPNEPFEVTWRRIESSLQHLIEQRSTDNQLCVNVQQAGNTVTVNGGIKPDESRSCGGDDFATELSARLSHAKENAQTGEQSPPRDRDVSVLVLDDCVDPRRDSLAHRNQIVPFSSLHDKAATEYDDLSMFNDAAELEMLMMSTPDLQGPSTTKTKTSGDVSEETSKLQGAPEKHTELTQQPPPGTHVAKSEQSGLNPGKPGGTIADEATKPGQTITKRKVVSFEETHAAARSEFDKARRLSDATDNSSGRESDSKEMKRSQKRTYSRLRQSVTQEDDSLDSNTRTQSNTKAPAGDLPQTAMKPTEDADIAPKPPKRSRKTADDPRRRLSPKGLASGSSRHEGTSQAANIRARAKRRTRGMVPHLCVAD